MPGFGYEAALEAVREHLGRRAAEHSEAVAHEAARLAQTYEIDPAQARLAGLLHDWAREGDDATLLADARAASVEITPADERVPYLLHAKTGSAQIRERFPGLPDEIVRAVERHTMGAAEMSSLDIIVYLADMLEPGRSFDGVERLRELVGTMPLRDLYAEAYAVSLHHLIDRRKVIHPSTVDTWNAIVSEERR